MYPAAAVPRNTSAMVVQCWGGRPDRGKLNIKARLGSIHFIAERKRQLMPGKYPHIHVHVYCITHIYACTLHKYHIYITNTEASNSMRSSQFHVLSILHVYI